MSKNPSYHSLTFKSNHKRHGSILTQLFEETKYSEEGPIEEEFSNPPYIDDQDMESMNAEIEEWVRNDESLASCSWTNFIPDVSEDENPYLSQMALQKNSQNKWSDNPFVQFHSSSCQFLDIPDFQIKERQNFLPERNISFLFDAESSHIHSDVNEEIVSHIISSYFKSKPELLKRRQMESIRAPPLEDIQFISISFLGIQTSYPFLAPVQINAKLLQDKNFISDEWVFFPKSNLEFYQRQKIQINLNQKASFELPDMTCPNYLIFILSHILTVGGSEDLAKYYINGKSEPAQKAVNQSWPKNLNVFTPFAWTYVNLNDLIINEQLVINNIYVADQPLTGANMKSLVESAKKDKIKPKYKMSMTIKLSTHSVRQIEELTSKNYTVLRLLYEQSMQIKSNMYFSHQVQFCLESVSFKLPPGIKARNIFAQISLRKSPTSREPLELHHSQVYSTNDQYGFTKCYYHCEKGQFDENFVFDLPFPIENNYCFFIEFYHFVAQPKAKNDREPIGWAYIPIFVNGALIKNGQHQATIYYDKKIDMEKITNNTKLDQSNCVSTNIRFNSSLYSSDESLMKFIHSKGTSIDSISKITDQSLVKAFYVILDLLMGNLLHNPKKAIIGFVRLAERYNANPAPSQLFKCLFKQSKYSSYISDFFLKILASEFKLSKGFQRIYPLIFRTLSSFTKDELFDIKLRPSEEAKIEAGDISFQDITKTITTLANIEFQLEQKDLDVDTYNMLRLKKLELIRSSPDTVLEELDKLSEHQQKQGYDAEFLQSRLLQAAIIIEYLTLQNKIPPIFGMKHAAHAFDQVCSYSLFAIHDYDECPRLNGYCDSKYFNIRSLNALLYDITKKCIPRQQWEIANLMIDIIWTIYENTRGFSNLSRFFKLQKSMNDIVFKINDERMFGSYFKVTFYGSNFDMLLNNKTFIYREKNLTHLYDFSNSLIEKYQNVNKNIPIELIKEKGEVDKSKLSPDKGYIQITYVEPYLTKNEMKVRRTPFERSNFITKFFFDSPFLKDSNKIQGEIDEQWIRRTLIYVKYPMPYISKIQEVEKYEEKEFMPIRVSYRQLRDQLNSFEKAIEQDDTIKIQQLLHGTLLAQVNVGPCKIAEVFLSDNNSNNTNDKIHLKYVRKLKEIFGAFIPVIKKALEIHDKMVQSQHEFRPMQDQLEAAFVSFNDTLSKYQINKK
ncbi:Dedicator of cytokinesis family protein [Histomonas meleagridis]|uniref:Dedicator of cytokinesis family protein n=1 Tax=Histomonas meleagridis TaxID=135588 RepID=UPI00355974DE|nr:Dedicator of cytokinesis family protein [Histomonas meleagridis]KAH0798193.1 Dedicator of cytokinesis family protein [Histomonas meleagridis]